MLRKIRIRKIDCQRLLDNFLNFSCEPSVFRKFKIFKGSKLANENLYLRIVVFFVFFFLVVCFSFSIWLLNRDVKKIYF